MPSGKDLKKSKTESTASPLAAGDDPGGRNESISALKNKSSDKILLSFNSKDSRRTIRVKIGDNDAQFMTPGEAAAYFKTRAASNDLAGSSLASISGKSSKLRDAGLSAAAHKALQPILSGTRKQKEGSSSSSSLSSPPCSEKEMKHLMSMFVEVMSLQMNTDKLNAPSTAAAPSSQKATAGGKALFTFPQGVPPPPGGWQQQAFKRADDEVEDEELEAMSSLPPLPELEDVPEKASVDDDQPPSWLPPFDEESTATTHTMNTLYKGIARYGWEALERIAIEDALEQEERKNQAQIKRNMLKTEKAIPYKDIATAKEHAKNLNKRAQNWRQVVAAACQANDCPQLKALLVESPLPKDATYDLARDVQQHLDFLAPFCLAKHRSNLDKGREARLVLADWIMAFSPTTMWKPQRNGRPIIHSTCLMHDVPLAKLILAEDEKNKHYESPLETTCDDSGWTALHYASIFGSRTLVEALLAKGARVETRTSDLRTWRKGTTTGLTVCESLELLEQRKTDKQVETHGMALEDIKKELQHMSVNQRKRYWASASRLMERLRDVQANGFSALTESELDAIKKEIDEEIASEMACASVVDDSKGDVSSSATSQASSAAPQATEEGESVTNKSKRKKKKKKKKKATSNVGSTAPSATAKPTATVLAVAPQQEDLLLTALKGMGFNESQIIEAVEACGGLDRATADEVVMRILGRDCGEAPTPAAAALPSATTPRAPPILKPAPSIASQTSADSNEEQRRLAAERLAAKREEQRRRNREWNAKQAQAAPLVAQQQDLPAALPRMPEKLPPSGFTGQSTTPSANDGSKARLRLPTSPSSSFDHGTIEIGDDITVSTMGSWQTRSASLPPQQSPFGGERPSLTLPPLSDEDPGRRAGCGRAASLELSHAQSAPRNIAPPGFIGGNPIFEASPTQHVPLPDLRASQFPPVQTRAVSTGTLPVPSLSMQYQPLDRGLPTQPGQPSPFASQPPPGYRPGHGAYPIDQTGLRTAPLMSSFGSSMPPAAPDQPLYGREGSAPTQSASDIWGSTLNGGFDESLLGGLLQSSPPRVLPSGGRERHNPLFGPQTTGAKTDAFGSSWEPQSSARAGPSIW